MQEIGSSLAGLAVATNEGPLLLRRWRFAWGKAVISKVPRIHLCGRMQREPRRQGFSGRGLYRIDELQVLRLFERVTPGGVVFARLSTVRHQFRGGSCIRARHYNLNFHSIQTSAAFDASRGEPGDVKNLP